MVSSDRPVSLEDEVSHSMKEMIGGCCVCSDERGWAENPLVYCDGHGCSVAVHQGKHPTARRAEPAPPTVTAAPPTPRPGSNCQPRPSPVPRLREGLAGSAAGRACGRKCVWPGLSRDGALTLSSVIGPPPAQGSGSGVGGRAPRVLRSCCRLWLGNVESPPAAGPCAVCRSVRGDFLGSGPRAREAGAGRLAAGLGSVVGRGGGVCCITRLLPCQPGASCGEWTGAQAALGTADLGRPSRLGSGRTRPLPLLWDPRGGGGAAKRLGSLLVYLWVFSFGECVASRDRRKTLVRDFFCF